jgi:hypothetical protein
VVTVLFAERKGMKRKTVSMMGRLNPKDRLFCWMHTGCHFQKINAAKSPSLCLKCPVFKVFPHHIHKVFELSTCIIGPESRKHPETLAA